MPCPNGAAASRRSPLWALLSLITAAAACSSPVALGALSDPVVVRVWNGAGSCVNVPTATYAPVSGACMPLPGLVMSIQANCSFGDSSDEGSSSTIPQVSFALFHSSDCQAESLVQQGSGIGDGQTCFALFGAEGDDGTGENFVSSASAACPTVLPDSTVRPQDLRTPAGTASPTLSLLLPFALTTVDPSVNGSLGLLAKDINNDQKMDLVSFATGGGQVVWYENLGVPPNAPLSTKRWRPHLIATLDNPVYVSFADIDNDSRLDIVVASGFRVPLGTGNASLTEGALQWFRQIDADTWTMYPIGRLQGVHRIQTGDFNGDNHGEVIAVPLFSDDGVSPPPLYGASRITMFEPLDRNHFAPWNASVVNTEFHTIFNAINVPKRGGAPGSSDLLLSSSEGVARLSFARGTSYRWSATSTLLYNNTDDVAAVIASMASSSSSSSSTGSDSGSGSDMSWFHGVGPLDVARGTTSPGPRAGLFIAAVDRMPDSYLDDPLRPWEGDTVAVYTHPSIQQEDGSYRSVDTSLDALLSPGLVRTVVYRGNTRSGGHTVKVGDLNNDGCADIVVGFRGPQEKRLMIFLADSHNSTMANPSCLNAQGQVSFSSSQIVSERSVAMLSVFDADGDGQADILVAGYGAGGDGYILSFYNRYQAWYVNNGGGSGGSGGGGNSHPCAPAASKLTWQLGCFVASGVAGLAIIALIWQWQRNHKSRGSRARSDRSLLTSPDTLRMRMLK